MKKKVWVFFEAVASVKLAREIFPPRERGTVRVKCLAQQHNTMSQARAELKSFDLESNALTVRKVTDYWL